MARVSGEKPDRLEAIFEMQRSFAESVRSGKYPGDTEARISVLCTAIIQEAVELQRTTNWKWWKKPTTFDEGHAREELVDILHFVIQVALELGLTPDDILAEYRRKNKINRERQRTGY